MGCDTRTTDRTRNGSIKIPVKRIFHYINKIIHLIFTVNLGLRKLVNRLNRLKKKQMSIQLEIIRLGKKGKPTTALEFEKRQIDSEMMKHTNNYLKLLGMKSARTTRK